MILFGEAKKYVIRILLASVAMSFSLLQGCACGIDDDTCNYEPGVVALWSDNNEKLAVVVTDYGDNTSDRDNSRSIATLDLDGSDTSHAMELASEQLLNYFSASNNYMILASENSSSVGIRQYQRLDLDNMNLETLVTSDGTCVHRHVIPSLDGNVLGVVEITGQENGSFVNTDPNYSGMNYQWYYDNADSNTGCNKLVMKVTLIDEETNEVVTEFLNEEISLGYSVSRTNSMSIDLNMYWSNQGLIINTHSVDKTYSIFKLDGSNEAYSFPQNCYPLATSSSYVSKDNERAKVFVILDDGLYSQDNKVELSDLSASSRDDYSWIENVPSVGQEICVL